MADPIASDPGSAQQQQQQQQLFAGLEPYDDGLVTQAFGGSPDSLHSTPADLQSNRVAFLNGTASTSPANLGGLPTPSQESTSQQQPFFDPNATPNWNFADVPQFPEFNGAGGYDTGSLFQQQPQQQQQWGFDAQEQQPAPDQLQTDLKAEAYSRTDISPASLYTSAGPTTASNLSPSPFSEGVVRPNPSKEILNTLTPAQQEKLKSIAMPAHLQYHSPKSEPSPRSSTAGTEKGAMPSPEATETSKGSRKRKTSADFDEEEDEEDDNGQPVKKTAHNMIEKRYRTNLNDKIAALRDSVPALRIMSKSARGEDTTEDREELHGLTPAHKLNKATVLSKATEYIRHLEKRNNRLLEENNSMQARINAFEKLFMAGALGTTMPNPLAQQTQLQYPQDTQAFMASPIATPRGSDPPGMIPVPEDMRKILASQQVAAGRSYAVPPQQAFQPSPAIMRQQQIQQQQQQMQNQRWGNAPYFGKLMVGSLAGLMIVEAVRETEQSNETPEGRGLFALPVQLLMSFVNSTHFSIAGYHVSTAQFFYTLKVLILFGALLWVFVPSIFAPKPPKTEKSPMSPSLAAVPSLASPIHVRRRAWLTAIQTVWVPRHNFFLEAAALILKTLKLSVRNTIGVHGYQMLTGLTEEQETARVKAWTIALDAQLAGGDVEINKSRLTLTLLASGTLPDTPLRLMLKALHIRVLLWQVDALPGLFNGVAAKLARDKWDEARRLHRLMLQLPKSSNGNNDDEELLPEHLAALLEEDCDSVLNDAIVQRAHNLAWNRPTWFNVVAAADNSAGAGADGMNAVVDDPAVRSPMDAVAAWYSNATLRRALAASLEEDREAASDDGSDDADLALAARVAPIGSNAQIRALVARTFAAHGEGATQRRGASIAAAMQAIAPTENPDKHPRYRSGLPPLIDSPTRTSPTTTTTSPLPDPDVYMALRCSQALAHLQKFASPPAWALNVINGISLPPHGNGSGTTLLGFAAAIHLMDALNGHAVGREACAATLERLAAGLRVWVGGAEGDACGLAPEVRCRLVERCLAVTKSVVGMEADPGYGSMSDCDEVEGGC